MHIVIIIAACLTHIRGSIVNGDHVEQLKTWLENKNIVSSIDDGSVLTFTSYEEGIEDIGKFTVPVVSTKTPCLNSNNIRRCLREKYTEDLQLNTYDEAREYMFVYTDNDEGWIEGLYGGMRMYVGQRIEDIRDKAYRNRKGFSTEHIYPKSLLPTSKSRNDIHNLYPSSAYLNTRRSTFPFINAEDKEQCQAFIDGVKTEDNNVNNSYLCIPNKDNNISLKGWEPRDKYKGDIARAVAYMTIVYEPETPIMEDDTILEWHQLDPVNEENIGRNVRVYEMQGNFNPFIVYPSLISEVFGVA